MNDAILISLALSNLVLAAIAMQVAARGGIRAEVGRAVWPLHLVIAMAGIVAGVLHGSWAVTAFLVAADVLVFGLVLRLIGRARRLAIVTERAVADIEWQRQERERALHDRCAGMF